MPQSRASVLFQKYFNKTASAEEQEELFRLLHHELDDESILALLDEAYLHFEPEASPFPEGSRQKMLAAIRHSTGTDLAPQKTSVRKLITRWVAAAAILAAIAIGYHLWNRNPAPPVSIVQNTDTAIVPGRQSATLLLDDGRRIRLSDAASGQLASENGITITKTNEGTLLYQSGKNGSGNSTPTFNTLSTGKGEQYQLKLPDGSQVWLNAASSIRYPVAFNGNQRSVELNGEAYFEVARSASSAGSTPFIVHTRDQQVEVLGTHFNVNAYDDEHISKTTLLEGAVRIMPMAKQLAPGQQLRVQNGQSSILSVHAEDAIAWKNGEFIFNNETLEEIMQRVARWYDVEVRYDHAPARKITFLGAVSRYAQIRELLKRLEHTDEVKFSLSGRILTVTAK